MADTKDSAFVSYSHKDTETVSRIIKTIEGLDGISVWFDHRLRGGENYFSVIADQIMESKYFIFIVSDNSIDSDWCLRELEFAASERKTIIAIWLDNISISPRVKLVIQNTHYINYYSATDESFSNSVRSAFAGGSASTERAGKRAVERDTEWNTRYFLEDEKLLKIKSLLDSEREGKYALCFQSENANLLGIAYELGIHTKADPVMASVYYRASSHSGNWDGQYLYASLKIKDCQDAFLRDCWHKQRVEAAEHGSPLALAYLGEDYYYGDNGCELDQAKAYRFWKQGAEAGNPYSMYSISFGYRIGEGVEKDLELAYIYALKATECGFPRAYRVLGWFYESGNLFPKDYQKATEMYDKAIGLGDYLSLCYKAVVCRKMGDYATSWKLSQEALQYAEEGKIKSGAPYYRVGYAYEYGHGVGKDLDKAADFYVQGAQRGHKNSLKYAVETILKLEDAARKEELLKKALEYGCKGAAYELGQMEIAHTGDERLNDAAVAYFTRGAENGEMDCVVKLLLNYAFIFGGRTKGDKVEALKWFQVFFANASEDYVELLRQRDLLSTYYYGYAIELDYDPNLKKADREFVQRYFKKSLDEGPKYLPKITGFVVDGYLFPETSGSGLAVDVPHAEEMFQLIEGYLPRFEEYLVDKENRAVEWGRAVEMLAKGYTKLYECYCYGQGVARDRQKAQGYKAKAAEMAARKNRI